MFSTIIENARIVIVSLMDSFNVFTIICENTNVNTTYLASAICLAGITIINDRFIVSDLNATISNMQAEYDLLKYRKDKDFDRGEGEFKLLNMVLAEKNQDLICESDELKQKNRMLKKDIDRLYCMSRQYVSSYNMERRYAFLKEEIALLNKLSIEKEE